MHAAAAGIPASSRLRGPDDGLAKDRVFCGLCGTKGLGPEKTLCDTEEMSYESQLSFIESEIGGISADAKAPGFSESCR